MKNRKYNISVGLAQLEDMWFQFHLRNEPYVVVTCTNQKKIETEDHRRWFTNALTRKDKYALFIVMHTEMCPHCDKAIEKQKIGYVWYKLLDRKSCTVSIAINREFQGKGYGVWALNLSIGQLHLHHWHNVGVVWANVRVDNKNSLRFFDKCGFVELYNPDKYDDVMNEGIVRLGKYI